MEVGVKTSLEGFGYEVGPMAGSENGL